MKVPVLSASSGDEDELLDGAIMFSEEATHLDDTHWVYPHLAEPLYTHR
jgi:hypothetical protein